MASIILAGLMLSLGLCGGCAAPDGDISRQLQDKNPEVRMRAMIQAGETKDDRAVPYLIECLNSDESDVRFFAYIALQKITGETMGYRYYESVNSQADAVQRWRQWAKDRPLKMPATQPKGV